MALVRDIVITADVLPDVRMLHAESASTGALMDAAKANAQALVVNDAASLAMAEQWTHEVLAAHDALETKLETWTKPLNALLKMARGDVKPRLDTAKAIIATLKGKCTAYRADMARLRFEAEAEARRLLAASAPVVETRAAMTVVAELQNTKSEAFTYIDNWVGIVVDEKAVPDQYARWVRVIDVDAIDKAVSAGAREIPGVKIENRQIMRRKA